MGYGNSRRNRTVFGTTFGTNFNRSGVGQISFTNLFDQTVVTPAERIAQYGTLGAVGGLAAATILLLGTNVASKRQRWPVLGLLAIPAVAAVGGIALAGSEYQR